jgi:ligand-binding sensor domain-containing protein/anti-sigma regulatory factor (Ser/Thr protein kinase)
MNRRVFYLLAFLITTLICSAQSPSLFFERITSKDGLSNDQVNCILQDRRGFIWIGTNDGLNRFDGHNFIIFRNRPGDTSSISGNTINDIIEDSDGILWIATGDGGLARYDFRAEPSLQFKQYKHQPGDSSSIPENTINAMAQDNFGYLWLATSGSAVIRFNKLTGQFDFPVPGGPGAPRGPRGALDLCFDSEGKIWAGRVGGGILKIDPARVSYDYDKRYDNFYGNLPHVVVTSLYCDKQKIMWYGSWDKVLYRYDPLTKTETVYRQDESVNSFINDEIKSFAEDSQGRLWIGGKTIGLQVMNKQQQVFHNYRNNPMQEGSIADNTINCIYIDKEGRTWLGTPKGISVWNPSQDRFTQTFLLPHSNPSPSLTIYDFYHDENNYLWIGTSDGIFLKKNNSSPIVHLPVTYQGNKLAVTKFFRDKEGQFYIGTNYSLFLYNKETNSVSLLPNTEKDKVMNKIIESRVVSVVEDVIDGHPVILVSPYGHYLAYYDLQEKHWVSRLDSTRNIITRFNIKDNLIHRLYRSASGKIWLAAANEGLGEWLTNTKSGSVFYTNDPLKNEGLSNNHVFDITGDGHGNLWVSTYGGGLNFLSFKGRKIRHMGATNNLLEGIATDKKGNVWMITNGNLQKYDTASHSSRTYNLPDLEKSGGVKGYIYKDNEGRMYVAGNNYFIEFHPDSIDDTKAKPTVYLTDFKIFNTSYSHLLSDNTIRLSHRQNYFTLEFAAPEYALSQTVQYQYMLEGLDKEWMDNGSRNSVVFSNLSGGTYTFRVRATNNPGTWSEMVQKLKIIITPPIWKRWWFYGLCAIFIAVSIYFLYRYRINEILKRQAIRNKIAQDLHDNVGSTLSSISVYSQVAQIQSDGGDKKELNDILGKISITSTDMISEMNDIVWAINPRNDSMEKIVQRMESFAKPLLAACGIHFSPHYDEAIYSAILDMEKRKNFYLIFKEAINNIVKYSKATEVFVEIKIKNRKLELLVKDDGIGFDPGKMMQDQRQSLSGNGLRNMKMRAAEMKAEIKITSQSGKGTVVQLTSTIP